jgi:hypothetical protein
MKYEDEFRDFCKSDMVLPCRRPGGDARWAGSFGHGFLLV